MSCDGLESEVVAHVCAIEASPGPSRFGLWSTARLLPSALPDTSLHPLFTNLDDRSSHIVTIRLMTGATPGPSRFGLVCTAWLLTSARPVALVQQVWIRDRIARPLW